MKVRFTEAEHIGCLLLKKPISETQFRNLADTCHTYGISVYGNRKKELSEQVKAIIIDMVSHDRFPPTKYSIYISKCVGLSYTYVANTFSDVEGMSIEQFLIRQRVAKVKTLLCNYNYSISEIAAKMGYSSIGHLSNQFKKVTGMTPSHFKKAFMDFRQEMLED